MEISNIASHQVNFKSQPQTQTSPIKAIKNKFENLEDKEKITIGLSALGVLALAALAIAKRPHKAAEVAQEVVQNSQKGADEVAEVAQEVVQSAQSAVGHISKEEKTANAVAEGIEKGKQAVYEYLENNGNYGQIKLQATRNQTKTGKKVAKAMLQEAHSAKVAQDIANSHNLSNATVQATQSANIAKSTRQGLQNVTDGKKLKESIDTAINAAENAKEKAVEARKLADEIGTKKAKKAAYRAEKAAERTKVEADKTEIKAIKQAINIDEQNAQKNSNRAEQMSNPNFEDGLIKQMLNEDKGAKTRLKNLIKKKTQHGKMSEKQALEAIVNDSKETELTRKLAKERLANL